MARNRGLNPFLTFLFKISYIAVMNIKQLLCHLHVVLSNITCVFIMHFRVIPYFLAFCETTEEVLMMKKILDGAFTKYMGNDGLPTRNSAKGNNGDTLLAPAHWSYIFGNGEFLITDLQGT